MGNILPIVELGNPVLRQPAKAVKQIDAPEIQTLISDMKATLKDAKGVGLAAPQVGHALRLYLVKPGNYSDQSDPIFKKTLVVINPIIIAKSKKTEMDWEGCLSIPGIRGLVQRPKTIDVQFYTETGEKIALSVRDFPARIFQHEHDHIDGIVFLDRMKDMRLLMTENEYLRQLNEDEIDDSI